MPSQAATPETPATAANAPQVQFDYDPATRVVQVRYRLRNEGAVPLAVFDRGDLHAVGTGRQAMGAVGIPKMVERDGDIELVHAVAPLPDPAPTSPPTPLAIELAPGAELSGRFTFALKGTLAPRRLRWCVGVMDLGAAYMDSPQASTDGTLWRASFDVVQKQRMLCSPWTEVAGAA